MRKSKKELLGEAESEARFYNREYADDDVKQRQQNYMVPERFIRQVMNPDSRPLIELEYAYSLLGRLEGKILLDYGAGDGWNTICLAKARAMVTAMDISEKGIELINKKAIANGVSEYVKAEVQNGYETTYESNTFDVIYGNGILHHLDVETAGQEIRRILRPDGVAVFSEPIGDTRIMDVLKAIVLFFLRRKPLPETEHEAPLTSARIRSLEQYFKVVRFRHFNVLSSARAVVRSEVLNRMLLWADYYLIEYLPGFEKLGRAVIIELREPIKMGS